MPTLEQQYSYKCDTYDILNSNSQLNKSVKLCGFILIAHAPSSLLHPSPNDLFLSAWAWLNRLPKTEKKRKKRQAKKIKVGHLSLFEFKSISVWWKPNMQINTPLMATWL